MANVLVGLSHDEQVEIYDFFFNAVFISVYLLKLCHKIP